MTETTYFRPLVQTGQARPPGALSLAGGWGWFTHAERLSRGARAKIVAATDIPEPWLHRLIAPRTEIAGLDMGRAKIMGILNVTPDSFSDGGKFNAPQAAHDRAQALVAAGADILDIGGESTRPGAQFVPADEECARTIPVIEAIRAASEVPMSIDTRKFQVGQAALSAGANVINDVSAFTFEPELGALVAAAGVPVCLMHAQGDPETMQKAPAYENVLLDVYDFLEARIAAAGALGVPRHLMLADPGIGFGKTLGHDLALLNGLSLFHGLGVPLLLGASRKKFIGALTGGTPAEMRAPGSLGVTLAALAQGVQIHRVHDVGQTRQAMTMWDAVQDPARGLGKQK